MALKRLSWDVEDARVVKINGENEDAGALRTLCMKS